MDVVHADDRPTFTRLSAGGAAGEIRFRRGDGVVVPAEVAVMPVEFGGAQATLAVARDLTERRALEERRAHDQAVMRELELARSIQQSMVPSEEVVDRACVKLAGHFQPAEECGGDWWTYSDLVGGKLMVLIGDATGHGIPAAMMTTAAKAASDAVRAASREDLTCPRLLGIMNQALFETAKQQLHMTCFVSILDPTTRTLTYANAAHELPYLLRKGELKNLIARGGSRLGDVRDAAFDAQSITLEEGDTLVWYTDGLIDQQNEEGERYGARRFRRLLRDMGPLDPSAIRQAIVDDSGRFCGSQRRPDDVTMVVARVY
jgi:serine phosphatase RsbU (regulator of sigma subunit)